MNASSTAAAVLLEQYTAQLAKPTAPPLSEPWAVQSLANGAAGIGLLHTEIASSHSGLWRTAHHWIVSAASGHISAADSAGLFLGAPAVGFLLSTVPPAFQHLYSPARKTLHRHITHLAHRRTDTALARISRRDLATFAEYDLFHGLTGIGAYLLRTDPDGGALHRVLSYLVALTRPLAPGGRGMPGWWVRHDPARGQSHHFPGGHGNLGAAHGITGPLLLLAQALRSGVTVPGHREAMWIICEHLADWCQYGPAGPWWPEHLSRRDLENGHPHHSAPTRPSWCYGTTGIARAGQLAGIALHDPGLQTFYEDTLYQALTDPVQLAQVTDNGLCHGWAGIYQTAIRAAADSSDARLDLAAQHLGDTLATEVRPEEDVRTGLLNGSAGTALALLTLASQQAPTTGWDTCLLIN